MYKQDEDQVCKMFGIAHIGMISKKALVRKCALAERLLRRAEIELFCVDANHMIFQGLNIDRRAELIREKLERVSG